MSINEWSKFFPDEETRTTIDAARNKESEQKQTWDKISHSALSKDALKKVETVVQECEAAHNMVALENFVGEKLDTFTATKGQIDQKRAHGGGRLAYGTQSFLNTFSEFLSCYSDIVAIVKTADNQFGGVAVQALSVFLIVAVNKQHTEDLINSSLAQMKSQFPRLKGLRDIYPTQKMRELIVAVYNDVIAFAESAVKYYARSTWIRIWHAIASPPQIQLQGQVNIISGKLSEVKEETNFLLNQRVKKLEDELAKANAKLDGVHSWVEQATKEKERDLLEILKHELLLGNYSGSERQDDYRNMLDRRFTPGKLSPFKLSDLEAYADYQMWYKEQRAQTLVIRGSTRSSAQTALSWLSSVAVEIAEKLRSENAIVISYFCRLEDQPPQEATMENVLNRLIYELYQLHPHLLENGELERNCLTRIRKKEWGIKRACELFVDIVEKVGLVCLIVDRPEECKGGIRGLSFLLTKAKEKGCMLKTLVVLDKDTSNSDEVVDIKDEAEGFLFIDNVNQ